MTETNTPSHNASDSARTSATEGPALASNGRAKLRGQTWVLLRSVATAPSTWRREHWVLGACAVLVTLVVGVIMPTFASATRSDPDESALTTL